MITDRCIHCGQPGRAGHADDCVLVKAAAELKALKANERERAFAASVAAPKPILPADSEKRKNTPVYSGLIKYFPRALAAVAQLSLQANEKHNPGEPLHWSEDKSNDHLDAATRHLFEAGSRDPETGRLHDVAFAWRALANLETVLKAEEKDSK